MLMKIALVLITILLVSAAFITLINEGGDTVTGETEDTNSKLDCVMKNKDDALEKCRDDTSEEIKQEVQTLET